MSVEVPADTLEKLGELMRLLGEAYEHYFEHSDGYCKSSEGAISLSIPPYYWSESGELGVSVYSYVFGPQREHWFDSMDEALLIVREWHAREMDQKYDAWGDPIAEEVCS